MKFKVNPNFTNRPKHIFEPNSFYFLTARALDGQWFLQLDKYKQIVLDKILEKTKKFNVQLIAYVILNNHYHLIIKPEDAQNIPKFIREINGASAKEINDADNYVNRKIWWNYFDRVIRGKEDFFSHLNYIHQNPIKHFQSQTLDYKFSSYHLWVDKKGQEYIDDAFGKYPIIDFKSFGDEDF